MELLSYEAARADYNLDQMGASHTTVDTDAMVTTMRFDEDNSVYGECALVVWQRTFIEGGEDGTCPYFYQEMYARYETVNGVQGKTLYYAVK
jgi:hypothetical protein